MALGAGLGAAAAYTSFPVTRYWAETGLAGKRYVGTTASNTLPREPVPPLFSLQVLRNQAWTIPHRLVLLRWKGVPGTIAADTAHFGFGQRLYVPGYGWGVVEDRGSAVRGPARLDLYFKHHQAALDWGRRPLRARVLATGLKAAP
mmetsp:Transcript_31622/g.79206  ORF Transcript_31622/g.79206 Transcript_31622/m.79206 type:complete len:146 (-) Transcript_31622:487-924(-)